MVNERSTYKLLRLLKVSEREIERVMANGEHDVEVPDGVVVMDVGELRGIKEKVKFTYRKAYPEIFGKELNRKLNLGLSVTEAKDISKVVKAIRASPIFSEGEVK